MARVKEESQFYLPPTRLIYKCSEQYLPIFPSRKASPHFGRYSLPIPMTVGGWVAGCLPRRYSRAWSPISVLTGSTNDRSMTNNNIVCLFLIWHLHSCYWNNMLSERADFAPVPPPGEPDEAYASFLILAYMKTWHYPQNRKYIT